MRKIMLTLASCLLSSQMLIAGCCDFCSGWPAIGTSCTTPWPSPINIDFGGGYRQDKFRWSIAGFEDFPNVLSQLEWKKLRIAQVGFRANYVSCRNYAIQLEAQYGRIYHGHVIDSDWESNDKTDLFSLSNNNAGKGHVYDLSAAAGYRITSTCFRFVATPLIGYSQYAQYLHLFDGHQIFPSDFHFPGLHSTYHAKWYGPWLGINFESRVERCAFLFGGFEWHMLAYRGHGNWNLRRDISRFDHKAYGYGYLASLGGKWEIWNNWAIGIMGTYRNFKTKHGHEHLIFHDPEEGPIPIRLRFNQAKWRAYTVSGIIAWRF
jgi:hypothetical protein